MTDTSRVTNRNDVAIIDFKVDENGNPSINIDESINSNLTAQQIEETKSIWATLLEIFTPEAINKPREIKILYDSKYNERLQQNLDGGLDAESAHLDAVAGTFGDFVEREGSDYFFGNVYSVDSDMPGAEIAGPIMSYPVDKLKNDVDQSNVVADAFRDFFADNSNNNDSSNSELWVNEDGHLFLLDADQHLPFEILPLQEQLLLLALINNPIFLIRTSVKLHHDTFLLQKHLLGSHLRLTI